MCAQTVAMITRGLGRPNGTFKLQRDADVGVHGRDVSNGTAGGCSAFVFGLYQKPCGSVPDRVVVQPLSRFLHYCFVVMQEWWWHRSGESAGCARQSVSEVLVLFGSSGTFSW